MDCNYETPMTLDETAAFLKFSKSHLQKLTAKGRIPCHRPCGKLIRFFASELVEWIRSGKPNTRLQRAESIASKHLGKAV